MPFGFIEKFLDKKKTKSGTATGSGGPSAPPAATASRASGAGDTKSTAEKAVATPAASSSEPGPSPSPFVATHEEIVLEVPQFITNITAPKPKRIRQRDPAFENLFQFLDSVYADPFQKRSKNELLSYYSKLYKALQQEPNHAFLTDYGVDAVPASIPESARIRNMCMIEIQLASSLADYCEKLLQRVKSLPHLQLKIDTLCQCFESYQLSTQLARLFVMGSFDQVKLQHRQHNSAEHACYCCEPKALFNRQTLFRNIAMNVFLACSLGETKTRQLAETFIEDTLWAEWNGDATEGHALVVKLQTLSHEVAASDWFVDVVARSYSEYLRYQHLNRENACLPSELVCFFADKFKTDFVAAVKSFKPKVVGKMQVVAALYVEHIAANLQPEVVQQWFMNAETDTIQKLYYLYALQLAKIKTVVWLKSIVRTCAKLHLEKELTSAIGGPIENLGTNVSQFNPQAVWDAIFDWQGHYDDILKTCCANHPQLKAAVLAAATSVLLHGAELLAFLIHSLISKHPIERIIDLFRFMFPMVEDQDVCITNMQTFLERRLLYPGANLENERELVVVVKSMWPGSDSMRMITLLKNASMADEYGKTISAALERCTKPKVPLSLLVLASNCCSLGSVHITDPLLPEAFKNTMEVASKAYVTQHRNTKLAWVHSKSYLILKARCFKTQYDITVPLLGYLLLHAFDAHGRDTLTTDEIFSSVNKSSKAALGFVSQFLKMGLIAKESEGDKTQYRLNRAFHKKNVRKLNLLPAIAISHGKNANDASVKADRDLLLQAILVRIMKNHRTLKHSQLVEQCILQLRNRFVPSIPAIKRAVESLLEKEYLARSEEDHNTYLYLA